MSSQCCVIAKPSVLHACMQTNSIQCFGGLLDITNTAHTLRRCSMRAQQREQGSDLSEFARSFMSAVCRDAFVKQYHGVP